MKPLHQQWRDPAHRWIIATEYLFLAVLLSLCLSIFAGITVTLTCMGAHLTLAKEGRSSATMLGKLGWIVFSSVMDGFFILWGVMIHFHILGANVWRSIGAWSQALEGALLFGSGMAAVRLALIMSLRIARLRIADSKVNGTH